MSNEIRATGNLQIIKDGFSVTGNNTQTLTLIGTQYIGNIQSIGTSYEPVVLGDLTDVRYMYLLNQSTASISVAVNASSQSFSVLQPDDVALIPFSASMPTIFLKSSANGADCQVVACES